MPEQEWLECDAIPKLLEYLVGRASSRQFRLFGCLMPRVVNLAQAIYENRAFDRLPALAEALEQAGCQEADLLAHCREPGPHIPGCWPVDLLLGKE